MPRKPAAPKVPKPKPLFSRNEVIGIAKRFLKPDAYDGARDVMVIYRLIKQFPSAPFWRAYELPFKLNATLWFLGKDGQAQLKRDFDVFHLTLPPVVTPVMEETKVGEDAVIVRKPQTMAELLS